jgi:hypothetical protein
VNGVRQFGAYDAWARIASTTRGTHMITNRTDRALRRLAPLAILALSLAVAACGGVPGTAADSPTAVVQEALDRMQAKDLDALPELACAAQRDSIAEGLDLTGGLGDVLPGLDTTAFLDAIEFDLSNVTVTERSVEGDTAEVGVGGALGLEFDPERLRDVMRPVLEQQGMPTDDATIDAMLGGLSSMAQNMPIDETVELVREDGAWKICDPDFVG